MLKLSPTITVLLRMISSSIFACSSVLKNKFLLFHRQDQCFCIILLFLFQELGSDVEIDTIPDEQQGKVVELRMELGMGGKKDKNHSAKKIALKKIVANMTMSNNDMVALFPDVINCMTIPSLEIKKMCNLSLKLAS